MGEYTTGLPPGQDPRHYKVTAFGYFVTKHPIGSGQVVYSWYTSPAMARQTGRETLPRFGTLLTDQREERKRRGVPPSTRPAIQAEILRRYDVYVSTESLKSWESGMTRPDDRDKVVMLAEVYDLDRDELLVAAGYAPGPAFKLPQGQQEPGTIHADCKFTDRMDEDWGTFVQERRGKRGLDQYQFAEEAKISLRDLAQMEGGRVPTKGTVEDLALSLEENMHDWLSAAGHDAVPAHFRAVLDECCIKLAESAPCMPIPLHGQLEDHAVRLWDASEGAEVITIPVLKGVPVPDFALRVGDVPTRQFAKGDILLLRKEVPVEVLSPGDLVLATGTGRTGPDEEGPDLVLAEFRGITNGRIRLRELTTKKRKANFAGDEVYAGLLMILAIQPLADRVPPPVPQATRAETPKRSPRRAKRAAVPVSA